MPRSCCAKPVATIIKVGIFNAGIVGLEAALRDIYVSGVKDEERVKEDLLRKVKELGNYIASGNEAVYKDALLREYRKYVETVR